MGYSFPKELLIRLKQCNLVEYFQARFPDIPIHKSGDYYVARCPHPDHEDHNPSFRIHYDAQTGWYSWTCFACHSGKKGASTLTGKKNYGSDAIAFVQWLSDYSGTSHVMGFQEAVLELSRFFKITVPSPKKRVLSKQESIFDILLQAFCASFPNSEAQQYCIKRGLSADILKKYHAGTDGERLAFPLINQDRSIKGFIYRHLHQEEPKYIHSSAREGFIKSEYLFGSEHIDHSCHEAVITEGCFDVMMAQQYNMRNVFACLGTALTSKHAQLLKDLRIRSVILAFDGDEAGRCAIQRSIPLLREQGLSCYVATLPNNMDLCDFACKHKENTTTALQLYTMPDYEYELRDAAESYRTKKRRAQQEFIQAILQKASMIKDQKEYTMFRQYIFNEFDIQLETRDVQETQANLANPVSAETAA